MAVWCFVCDAPVVGSACPHCGWPGTVVEDIVEEGPPRSPFTPLTKVPKWVWIVLVAALVVTLFTLMQSGFHLE